MSSNASDDCSLDGIEDPNKSTFLADAEKNQHSSSFTPAFTSHSSVSYPVVNHLLTTVQSCSAEDSATSDYESTCSDSSFHFRHIIMSPRVLSPDSQTPSSGVVSQKDVAEFDYDDSSDASVDAYKSEPELAINALATQGKLFRPRLPGTPSLNSTSLPSTAAVPAAKIKRAFVFDLPEKPASDVASESFRRWRKSTSDAASNFPALSRACDPSFSVPSQLPNFVLGANKSSSAFKFANLNSYPGAKERLDANKKGPSVVSKLCEQQDELGENSTRSLGRSTSLPLSLHVATGMESGSGSVVGIGVLSTGQTSPCASSSSAVAVGVSHPSGGVGGGAGGAVSPFCGVFQHASLSPSSAGDVRRSRCPSTSSRCSASSPRPPSRIDQIKIEEATGLERDTLFERDVTLSSSLASSWEDLCLSENASSHSLVGVGLSNPLKRPSSSMSSSPGATPTPNAPSSSSSQLHTPSSSGSTDSVSSRVTEPISISCAPSPQAYNPTIYPLACSPSPTRVSHANSKQCYSPLAMPVNWSSPSCPSPTQRKVFRRSQSPVHMVRPGILSSGCGNSFIGGPGSVGVKRRPPPPDQLDSLEHTTPCKRPAPENTPPPPPPFFSTVPSQSTSGSALPHPQHQQQQQTHSHSVPAALSTNNTLVPNSSNNTNNHSVINTASSQPPLFSNMISISRNNSGSTSTSSSIGSLTNEMPPTTTSSSVCSSPCSTPSSPPPFGSPIRCFTPSLLSPVIAERGSGERDKQPPFGLPRSLNMAVGGTGGGEMSRGTATPVVQSPLSEQAKVINSETEMSQMEHN